MVDEGEYEDLMFVCSLVLFPSNELRMRRRGEERRAPGRIIGHALYYSPILLIDGFYLCKRVRCGDFLQDE